MKNISKIIAACFIMIIISGCQKEIERFYLDDELYGDAEIIEINATELEKMVKEKKSFALNIYQPLCNASYEFSEILNKYIEQENIKFYKIKFSEIENTHLSKEIKYYPSFAIYKDGELIDYLDAEADKHINTYKTIEGFEAWFTKYIKIKKVEKQEEIEEPIEEIEIKLPELDNITYDPNKVNIYFFWGDGCGYCKNQFAFLDSIKDEYGKYYNLYTFEVWGSEENKELLEQFAALMGDQLKGIPYTVIGNKTFNGFNESIQERMLDAIKSEYKNSYDVYFENK